MDDTIKLLRECDAGIKMGIASIDKVLDDVQDEKLLAMLEAAKKDHQKLQGELEKQLEQCHDEGKDANAIAQGMSFFKTNVKMAINESDATIAELMTDGCNMGVKSLGRYLNQYPAADAKAKEIANQIIKLELSMCDKLRGYL